MCGQYYLHSCAISQADLNWNNPAVVKGPWIPCHSRMKEVNLENDLASERSIYRFYQALLSLSREKADGLYQPYECAVCRVK